MITSLLRTNWKDTKAMYLNNVPFGFDVNTLGISWEMVHRRFFNWYSSAVLLCKEVVADEEETISCQEITQSSLAWSSALHYYAEWSSYACVSSTCPQVATILQTAVRTISLDSASTTCTEFPLFVFSGCSCSTNDNQSTRDIV